MILILKENRDWKNEWWVLFSNSKLHRYLWKVLTWPVAIDFSTMLQWIHFWEEELWGLVLHWQCRWTLGMDTLSSASVHITNGRTSLLCHRSMDPPSCAAATEQVWASPSYHLLPPSHKPHMLTSNPLNSHTRDTRHSHLAPNLTPSHPTTTSPHRPAPPSQLLGTIALISGPGSQLCVSPRATRGVCTCPGEIHLGVNSI